MPKSSLEDLIPGFSLLGGEPLKEETLTVETVETAPKEENVDNSTSTTVTETPEVDSENNNEEENQDQDPEAKDNFAEDDELDRRLGREVKKPKAKEDLKPKPKVKTEDKPKGEEAKDGEDKEGEVEEDEEVEGLKETPAPKLPNKQQVASRNLEGFDDEEKVLLGRMSNEAFNKFAPIIKEAKTFKEEKEKLVKEVEIAKKTIPAKSYFNEFGYSQDEEFIKAQETAEVCSTVTDFYKAQLINLKVHGKCYQLKGLDSNGKPVAGVIVEANDEMQKAQYEASINELIAQQASIVQQNRYKADSIRSGWAQKHQNATAMLEQQEKKFFPQLSVQGEKNEYVKGMMQTLREEGFGENPLAKMMCYLYATHMSLVKAINSKASAQVKTAAEEALKAKAGPSSRVIASGKVARAASPNGKTLIAKDEEFEERLRQNG